METNKNKNNPAVSEKKNVYLSPKISPNRQRDIEAKKKLKVQQNRSTFIQYDDNTAEKEITEKSEEK